MKQKRSKKYTIRQTEDLLTITALHQLCFPADEMYESTNAHFQWLVLDEDKHPVGFCILTIMEGTTGFLARAGILPEARGQGLQRRLIRTREMFAKKIGCTSVITYTKIENIASSVNLQKAKFNLFLPEYAFADKDCLYWIKEY